MFVDNIPVFALASLAVFLGAMLQTLAGFGMGLVAAPILVLINAAFLPAPIIALGCLLSIFNVISHRQHISLAPISYAIVGRGIGSVFGLLLLGWISMTMLSTTFALLIMAAVFLSMSKLSITYNNRNLVIGGFLSGVIGTTTSIGGPPIAMVMQNSSMQTAKAQLSLFFLISTIFSLVLLATFGHFSALQLELTLSLIPALVCGFIGASYLAKFIKPDYFKPAINIMSLMASVLILIKEWLI